MSTPFLISHQFDKTQPHHGSSKVLWSSMWRRACVAGVYPFMEGAVEDFDPIFAALEKSNINDGYDENYTKTFMKFAEEIVQKAVLAEEQGLVKDAEKLYLRAAAVYRIGRFPYLVNQVQREAWALQKTYYIKGSSLGDFPIQDMQIPHVHAIAGIDGSDIPVFFRAPPNPARSRLPLLLVIAGLDGYRTETSVWSRFACQNGWACLALEIPGTGDCPAGAADPESPDRLFRSVLDWVAKEPELDESCVVAWGTSTGAYYALRLAHVSSHLLKGAVVHGLGCHRMFEEEWLQHADQFEYPFSLTSALVKKFGFKTLEELIRDGKRKFSLIDNGILDQSHSNILLVNGTKDGIFPIEDSQLVLQRGGIKEARFIDNREHMGTPEALPFIFTWLRKTFAS